MPANIDTAFQIDEDTAEFIQRYVSVNIATRSADNRPVLARAAGCRIAEDRSRLTVYLPRACNEQLLDHLRDSRALAVVFSRPSTNRTIQFKGNDAQLIELDPQDEASIRAYLESFHMELRSIGFPASFCDAILPPAEQPYVGIQFTANRAYTQTPGPDAGKKISA